MHTLRLVEGILKTFIMCPVLMLEKQKPVTHAIFNECTQKQDQDECGYHFSQSLLAEVLILVQLQLVKHLHVGLDQTCNLKIKKFQDVCDLFWLDPSFIIYSFIKYHSNSPVL